MCGLTLPGGGCSRKASTKVKWPEFRNDVAMWLCMLADLKAGDYLVTVNTAFDVPIGHLVDLIFSIFLA